LPQLFSDEEISEASLVSVDIQTLAESLLSSQEIESASKLSRMLLLTEESRERAKAEVCKLAPMRPKRPLYYAVGNLWRLPEEARTSMKYFGDYLDILVKHWALLVTNDPRSSRRSLGINSQAIAQASDEVPNFLNLLDLFNESIYVPAKHDFELPEDRTIHRFTATEALLTASITVHLAERISAQHALLLADGMSERELSISTVIVDPLTRVLLTPVTLEGKKAYDIPYRVGNAEKRLVDVASRISEELTSKRGRVIRCLGLYERLIDSKKVDEMAFVISSPYVPDKAVTEGTVWLPTNDVHWSVIVDPAKDELDDML
jgi:hypothetical protein